MTIVASPILTSAASILRVQSPRNGCEWARENRILPPDSAEPGEFRPERTPYVIPISEAIASGKYSRVVAIMAAQMGKSDLAINTIGQTFDDNPVPALYIAPTKKLVESISRDRITKMIRNCPSLDKKISDGGLDNLTEKWISGTALRFIWASSASELSSHPACLVILDEIDRMPRNVCGEGAPLTLAEARTATYPDAIILILSTPTIEGNSPVWVLWVSGTKLLWHWFCLGCGVPFAPCLALLKWEKGVDKDTVYDAGAWIECPECNHRHGNSDKDGLNASGVYLGPNQTAFLDSDGKPVTEGTVKESLVASFRVSGICSPFKTFTDRAASWLEAVKEGTQETIKAVLNTVFAELYKTKGDAPDKAQVDALKADYPIKQVPVGAFLLTCGVDVHKRNLCFSVRAWGANDESWLVYSDFYHGDTYSLDIWAQLQELLDYEFIDANSKKHVIWRMAIDSQYRTDMIYSFAAKNKGRVMACDGASSRLGAPVRTSEIKVTPKGKKIKGGLALWRFDKHYFRDWLYGRMRREVDTPGRWHISRFASRDYCRQIVAEEMIAKPAGGFIWQLRTGYRANHYLDAEVHARVAAHVLNVDKLIYRSKNKRPHRSPIKRVR